MINIIVVGTGGVVAVGSNPCRKLIKRVAVETVADLTFVTSAAANKLLTVAT